jgi:iron complex outermembrane receptor protein
VITLSLAQKDFELSTGEQIEVGYKQLFWEGRGELTLAGYRITKDNLLTADPLRPAVSIQVGSQSRSARRSRARNPSAPATG